MSEDTSLSPDEVRAIFAEMYWTEGATSLSGRVWPEHRDAKLSVRDIDGKVPSAWGGPEPCAIDGFSSPHGLWVDRHGDVYVAEVTLTALGRLGQYKPTCHSLLKFVRV